MRKILSILFMTAFFVAGASAQQLEKLFDKYQEDERFNYIYQKKESVLNSMSDFDDYVQNRSLTSVGKQMLTLNSTDDKLGEQFTREIDNALKADKYEQMSIVRNGKNRVEKYEKKTNSGIAKVSFIKNPGNIMVVWNLYVPKK